MRQHSIDLMPVVIRARSRAGIHTPRLIGAAAVGVLVLIGVAAHARLSLARAQEKLFDISARAEGVYAAEAKATELRRALERTRAFTDLYDRIALPLDVSSVIATLVDRLPDSVSLDQIDIATGMRVANRTARSKGNESPKDEVPPRVLNAEVSGFAANDQQIAELVNNLSATPPLRDVSLDFSRSRDVNGLPAREFRLSFKIDLDVRYQAPESEAARLSGTEGGG